MKNKYIYLIPVLIALLLRLPFLNREFVLEETLHTKVVQAIANTGYPVIYFGEQQPVTVFMDRSPVLFFLFVPFIKIFGVSETSIRIVPVIFSTAEIITVIYFGLKVLPLRIAKPAVFLTAMFLAIHPYAIQNSLQIHFEGIFSFFSTLYLLYCFRNIQIRQNNWRTHVFQSAILAIAFSLKYETSLMIFMIVFIYSLFSYRKFLSKLIITSLASISLFLTIFYFYNFNFGHPEQFIIPFERLVWVIQKIFLPKFTTLELITTTRHLWADNYYLLIRFLSWLSIPSILLFIYAFFHSFNSKIYLLVWIGIYWGIYLLGGWAGDYPRYFAPSLPAVFMVISIVLVKEIWQKKKSFKEITISVLFAILLLSGLYAKGYLFLDHITGWVPLLQTPFFLILALGIILVCLAIIYKKRLNSVIYILFLVQIGQITIQYLHDLRSNYSLTNFYSYGGYKEAGKIMQSFLDKNKDTIYTFDPVGYYWEGKYFDHYQLGPHKEKHLIIKSAFETGNIAAIALPDINYEELKLILKSVPYYSNFINIGGKRGINILYR